jgi:dTDP-D-glucose 4,6-dehydratase
VIPKWILLLQAGKPLPVHGAGLSKRFYLYISDVISAFTCLLQHGVVGEVYNISGDEEISTASLAMRLRTLYASHVYSETTPLPPVSQGGVSFVVDRNFNDLRYCLDDSKLRRLGWKPRVTFDVGLKLTLLWYLALHHNPQEVWPGFHSNFLLPHSDFDFGGCGK